MRNPTIRSTARLPLAPLASLLAALAVAGCSAGATTTRADKADASHDAGPHAITLSIEDIAESAGTVRIALYSSAESFASREPLAALAVPVDGPALSLSLGEFPDGDYAVMLFQDLNGNEKLDRNLFGIPSEPWAGSLRESTFGEPGWDDARFELEGAGIALALSL